MVGMMVEMVEMMVEDNFPLIFLLLTSYFSLSFDFPPFFILLLPPFFKQNFRRMT